MDQPSKDRADQEIDSPAYPRNPSESRGWRAFWPPVILLLVVAVALVGVYVSRWTPDYKNSFAWVISGATFLALLVWTGLFSPWPREKRWKIAAAMILAAAAPLVIWKPQLDGDMKVVGWRWRWGMKADAKLPSLKPAGQADLLTTTPDDFPQFLGKNRHPIIEGISLATDWDAHPPRELWKKPIGSGWSGFAVVNGYAVTQEQRGPEELVVCYELLTGEVVWVHSESVRFESVLGFDGPRATPTIDEGRVYALGATGILNCLDGANGNVIWRKNILDDNDAANLNWGMSGSPLIVDEMVIVGAGGTEGRSLVAYDKTSGDVIWAAGNDVASYASPAVATLGGVRQVLSVDQDWVVGHRLEDGEPLWRHEWPGKSDSNATASQAVAIEDRNWVFLSKGYEIGCTLLAIEQEDSGNWSATPVWDQPIAARMKTKMTNVAIRDGLVFGLDGGILQCIDLATSRQHWKGGRYGNGQILLVGDNILVTTEVGELALVEATDESFRELAKIPVIEGRTWNNPALYGRYLLMRSEEEVACLELPLGEETP